MFIQLRMAGVPQFVSCFGVVCAYRAIQWDDIGRNDFHIQHDLFADWLLYNSNGNL